MKYWLLTVLIPNGLGTAHHAHEVTHLSPMEYVLQHYKIVLGAIEITKKEYDKGIERAKSDYPEDDPRDQTNIILIETSTT